MSDSRLEAKRRTFANHIEPVEPGQKFPIYTHLIKGGDYSTRDSGWGPYDKEQIEIFKDCTLVEGIDPEDLDTPISIDRWDHIQKDVDALGVIKLPFPQMWVEFEYLINLSQYTADKKVPGTTHGAAFVWETPLGSTQMTCYVRLTTGDVISMTLGLDVKLKEDGTTQEVAFGVASNLLTEKLRDLIEIQAIWAVGYPVLYALGLMNCKNVALESQVQRSRSSNKGNRKKVPKLEYRTIVLPQKKHLGVNQPGKGGVSAAGIHKVRGHFKTYTAEAPLFGKHVGKYWWPWSIRGDANKGYIISDYTVKK